MPDIDKKNESLKLSVIEGTFASIMNGFIQDYITPFLLLLGGTVKQVGIIGALPILCAAIMQVRSADLVEHLKSRKKIVSIFVFLQAVTLLPMFYIALSEKVNPYIFIVFVILFTSFGAFVGPAWGSLMSDLVDEKKRGEYFGRRNKILGFVTVSSTFLAGFILYEMEKLNIFSGFAFLFLAAFTCRIISLYLFNKTYEVPLAYKEEDYFTLFQFLNRIKESNFAKFVLFVSLMNFSVNLAAPFFAVLMLKDLKFSYLLYSLITITATLTSYFLMDRWGRHADKIGNLKIIRFTAPLIGIVPLLWLISRNPLFLFIAQVFSGFVWAGFNLCTSNFIYDAVTPGKRTRCISYFNVFNGLAICLGAILGGFFVHKLPPIFGYRILTLLLISSALRILFGIFIPIKLKEVRPVEKVSSNQLFFSVIGIKPLFEIERET